MARFMLADAMFLGSEGSLNRGSDLALFGGRAGGAASFCSGIDSEKNKDI